MFSRITKLHLIFPKIPSKSMSMSDPVVRISTGFLKGAIRKNLNDDPFYSFEGIPFAEPPIGTLRFKAPVPVKPWQGVKDATTKAPPNYSPNRVTTKTVTGKIEMKSVLEGSEDCLNLNVFTPSLPHDTYNLKPVMFYIHGGAFIEGGTQKYGPEVYLTEDIILVTTSYRLGALGFLAIDEPELGVTGNAGLKDMVLALKWVQKNIQTFNGDPNNVTIVGESAGGSAVHYLILSPTTKGLFQRAIIQSGSSLCTWARGHRDNGIALAKSAGYCATNKNDILKYLQNLTVEEVLKAQLNIQDDLEPSKLRQFAPVVENSNVKDAFLTEEPIDLLVSGKYNHVPTIFGYNNEEGGLFDLMKSVNTNTPTFTDEKCVVPHWLNLEIGCEEYMKVAKKIRSFYLKNQADIGEDGLYTENGKKLLSDVVFVRPILQSAKFHSLKCEEPIYLYRLSVVTELAYLTGGKTKGVCHADGLGYQFQFPNTPKVQPGSIEDISRKRIVKLFTNFAKSGNPNPPKICTLFPAIKWTPIKDGELKVLDISDKLLMEDNPEAEYMKLWDEIFQPHQQCCHY